MNKYQVFVDIFNDDSQDIDVANWIIEAKTTDDAEKKAFIKAKDQYPDKNIYIWQVLDEDIIS